MWVNVGNGIEAQVYGVLCEALSVKPQKVRRQVNRERTPRLKDPFELFVETDWCGCFSLCSSAVARFERPECGVFILAGRSLEQCVEYLTVPFPQLHGTQSRDGCKLRFPLVSSREHEGLLSISVHSENRKQLTLSEFFTCTRSFVNLGRPGWILLRPFPKSVTWGTRSQIAAAFINQARDEREKDVLIYVKKGYEIAQNMLDEKEVWSLQLRQRFFNMEVNLWRVGGVKYGRERLDQR